MSHRDGDVISPLVHSGDKALIVGEDVYWITPQGVPQLSAHHPSRFKDDPVVCNIFDVLAKVLYGNEQ